MTFIEHRFLPYHGGYTIVFRESTLYPQEQENANVLHSLGSCLRRTTA